MKISLDKDKLLITFKYNPKALQAIRSVPGRQFNLDRKRWEVPVDNAAECVEALEPLGFKPDFSVITLAQAQQNRVATAEAIRNLPAEYDGNLPLFEFQKKGTKFLKEMPNVLLADQPGLGKTIQTIAAFEKELPKILVLCPNSLKYTWKTEIEKWEKDQQPNVIDGFPMDRVKQWRENKKWTIANYELLLRDWSYIHKEWDVIVCDEATRISNPGAKTTKALKKLQAKRRIALTGTPISNRPDDIWSIIDWISPRYLGSYYQFTEQYCIKEPRFNRIVGYKNLDDLGRRVNRFMLRRTKEEVLPDLPPKIIEDIEFNLSEEEGKMYRGIRNIIASEIAKLEVNPQTLQLIPVKMTRLLQATDDARLLGVKDIKSSKLEALKEILEPIMTNLDQHIS